MMTRLSRIVVILRDIEQGLRFYRDGLGLRVEGQSKTFARLSTENGPALELNAADCESQCSTGYSPFLTFEVDDMDSTIPKLLQLGAALDGSIRYEPYGKLAAVRSPDGHMLGLLERANLPDNGDIKIAAASAAKSLLNEHDKSTK